MVSARNIDVMRAGDKVINQLLAVKAGEEVLLVADPETPMEMAYALAAAAEAAGAQYNLFIYPGKDMTTYKEKPHLPRPLEQALLSSDVVVALDKLAGARPYIGLVANLLKEKRIRYMSMILRSLDNWTKGAATADYERVYATAAKLAAIMEKVAIFRVSTPLGTDLTLSTKGRRAIIEAGLARRPGDSAAFCDGEVSKGVIEGSAKGVIVVDGPVTMIGQPILPMRLTVKKSRVIKVEGDAVAARLRAILATIKGADHIAEIGIGVNPESRRSGDWQEEKKAMGNVHIAVGGDAYYGGSNNCPVHLDMVNYWPEVWADGQLLVKEGKLFT